MGQGELPLLNGKRGRGGKARPLAYFGRHSLRGGAALFLAILCEQQFGIRASIAIVLILCISSDTAVLRPISVLSYSTVEKVETSCRTPLYENMPLLNTKMS